MKKNNSLSYDVKLNEEIVVTVTPKNFGDSKISVRANLDGVKLPPREETEDEPVYDVTIDDSVLLHTLILEFNFIKGTPAKAVYEVDLTGEDDQGCPCGFKVRKATANKEPAIEFFVKSEVT